MKTITRILAAVGLTLVALCAPAAGSEPPPLRILFIGTSLTYMYGVPARLASLASNAGESREVQATDASRPDTGLRAHWEGRARELVREARWDYVVLQGPFYTTLSSPGEFLEYARLFDGEIRKAGAKTILFLHWMPPRDREAQAKLNDIYMRSARDLEAIIAPVGPAWQLAAGARPRHRPLPVGWKESHPDGQLSHRMRVLFPDFRQTARSRGTGRRQREHRAQGRVGRGPGREGPLGFLLQQDAPA